MVLDIADLIIVKRVIQSLLHIERPSIILASSKLFQRNLLIILSILQVKKFLSP